MKKTVRKLQLSRETLHRMIGGPAALRQVLGGDDSAVANCTGVASCRGNTCPPMCTVNRACVG
jgi:hypothetical protein